MVQANRNTTHKNERVSKDESGVSAVIGVILMVAVTVILAAVIGAFIFSFAPDLLPNQTNLPFSFEKHTINTGTEAAPVMKDVITIINNGGTTADRISVHYNGYESADLCTVDPTDYPETLQAVGGQFTLGTGSATIDAGKVITVSGEINGNAVVLATYTIP